MNLTLEQICDFVCVVIHVAVAPLPGPPSKTDMKNLEFQNALARSKIFRKKNIFGYGLWESLNIFINIFGMTNRKNLPAGPN